MRARKLLFFWVLVLTAGALTACARPVFDPGGAATDLTPSLAAERIAAAEGRRVIWGGRIVASRNLRDSTELVVLGYPLERSQRPDTRGRPVGRFIAVYPGYLETGIFARDRLVTVDARVRGREVRPVGEASYLYPLVSAEAVHLWPEGHESGSDVHFGIGIGIGIDG